MSAKPMSIKSIPATKGGTIYPAPFAAVVAGRTKRKLGNLFELSNFGVNLTQLDPGSASALFHSHETQDEFIYILQGTATVRVGSDEHLIHAGEFIGFKAGSGEAHQLINNSDDLVTYLEVGDRSPGDNVEYPDDDIKASLSPAGSWEITHKDGTPY